MYAEAFIDRKKGASSLFLACYAKQDARRWEVLRRAYG